MRDTRTFSANDTLKRLKAEYGITPAGQLAARPQLLRVLTHLRTHRLVALMGDGKVSLWLDGFPDIALHAGTLLVYGYVMIVGHAEDSTRIVYLALSDKGRAKLDEGREWWRSLSIGQRLAVMVTG